MKPWRGYGRTPRIPTRIAIPLRRKHHARPAWTADKNQRRCALVDKEIDGTLSPAEEDELAQLQADMLAYRRHVAPLPLDDLRQLHQQLLRQASAQTTTPR